jgi:hypothetical protein
MVNEKIERTSGDHFFRLFAAGFMFAEAMIRTEERRC